MWEKRTCRIHWQVQCFVHVQCSQHGRADSQIFIANLRRKKSSSFQNMHFVRVSRRLCQTNVQHVFRFRVVKLLRYILFTCPNLWKRSCSKCYAMHCFGTYFSYFGIKPWNIDRSCSLAWKIGPLSTPPGCLCWWWFVYRVRHFRITKCTSVWRGRYMPTISILYCPFTSNP